jgi:hypothetical protein
MTFLEKVCSGFNSTNIRYALVGGHAVALHGAVRGTVDIDFVLKWSKSSLEKAEKVLLGLGLESRLPISAKDIFSYRDEYIKNRNLIAWNFYNPAEPAKQVDIIITYDLSEKQVTELKLRNGKIRLLSLPALIKMKKASGRPQDLEDIKALLKLR